MIHEELEWCDVCEDCAQYKALGNDKYLCVLEGGRCNGYFAYKKLKAENAELRARLEKAVEPPVKVGDTVYFIPTYNGKPIWGVQRGIVQMVGITRQGYHVKIRDRADFNKTYMFRKSAFLSKEQAEARLAELNSLFKEDIAEEK